MKKLFLLTIVLFIYSSCSSDDNSSQNYENQDIVGNWKITEYRDDYYNNISEVDDEPCFSLSTKTYNSNLILKYYSKYGSSCQNLGVTNKIFEINGNVLTETIIDGGFEPNTNYVVKYYIEGLTSTTL